jgi:dihydroxyacetone kinase-like protein
MVTGGKERPDPPTAAALAAAVDAGIKALTRLGKAEVGQKTLLDVLDPVQQLLAAGGDDLVGRVRQCAFDSAAATAQMDAIKGRASFLGDRALGHVDPGSRSMALIIGAVCDSLQGQAPTSSPPV